MNPIETVCPLCTERVTLAPTAISLTRHADDPRTGTYDFVCPACLRHVTRPADARALALLSCAGVRQSAPLAMHPEHPPTGPPFTTNDLIDLHLLLQQDNWFGRLQALDGAH